MQVLINVHTLTELNRVLVDDLKKAGHSRYSESVKKSYAGFIKEYKTEFSDESLSLLITYKNSVTPIFQNIDNNAKHPQLKELVQKIKEEIDRLIGLQEKNIN